MFSFETAILHVGHCFVPVSSIHCMNCFSSVLWLLAFNSACFLQEMPLWYGCALHFKHESFLQRSHRNFLGASSSRATLIGQSGVGQAHRSVAEETACSRLLVSMRSMISAGRSFRSTHSSKGVVHSGQAMWTAPTSNRASAYLCIQPVQYQP